MVLRRPHKGMKMASSVGMVEADPAPGPSLGPRDDRTSGTSMLCWQNEADFAPEFLYDSLTVNGK